MSHVLPPCDSERSEDGRCVQYHACTGPCLAGALKVAYSDPPYLGQGKKLYGKHHDQAHIWDDPETHREHIEYLCDAFPDGWAMSLSSPSLRILLPMCPEDVRVSAWVKPFHIFKPGVNPSYGWEPVIWRGGRSAKERGGREVPTVKDFAITEDWLEPAVKCNITLRKGLTGSKPEGFCFWLFDLLGLRPGDKFVDIFLGSGAVTDAWNKRCAEKEAA